MNGEKATYIIDLKDAFSPKLDKAARNLDGFENKLSKVTGGKGGGGGGLLGMLSTGLSRIAWPAMLAAGITMFATKLVTAGAELEKTKVSLEVLVGDAEKANKLFGQMTNFANVTPFANKDIIDSGKLLLSFGTQVKDVMPTISMLGDIAMGDSEKLSSLTLAFAQMSSTGRLMGQDLLQMINAGFNPLQVISEKTGKSMGELKKLMEQGAISTDMVKQAFIAATSEGGRFFGMMDKQSETISGKWSTLTGSFDHFLGEMGLKFGPMINRTLDGMIEGLNMLTRIDFSGFLQTFSDIFDVFSEVGVAFQEMVNVFFPAAEGIDTLQFVFNLLATSMRTAFLPLRALLSGFTLMIKLVDNLIDGFKGLGMMIIGVFTKDITMIKTGFDMSVKAARQGFSEVVDEVNKFAKREVEGYSKIWSAKPAEEAKKEQAERYAYDPSKMAFGAGKGKKDKTGKVDGEVRSGGVKNIVINIDKLVGEITFQKFDKMSDSEVVAIVKRALLTAVNDANTAVS